MDAKRRVTILVVCLALALPFAVASQKVFADVPAEPVPAYKTIKDLNGKVIATLSGTALDKLLVETTGIDVEFRYYNQVADVIQAVKSEKADALLADLPVCKLAVAQNPGLTIFPEKIAEDDYGMIFAKGNPLRDDFSRIIDRFRKDGTLARLEDKWCGSNEGAKVLPEQVWDTPNGTLRCATMGTLIPMAYVKDNEIVGYDIELSLLIAKELGYGVKFAEGDTPVVLGNVASGKADFGACCISITDERKESYDFTSPTYFGAATLVVRDLSVADADSEDVFERLASSFKRTFIEENRWQTIVFGLGTTVAISVVAGALGILVGCVTVLARRSRHAWPGRLVDGYQALMGGVPLVVVLMFLYYVVFGSFDVPGAVVAIIAFAFSFGSTAGSTMWTAVSSVDKIQEETGLALGLGRRQTFRHILFPQAASVFMPQLAGQFVGMVKETAIVGYIAVLDLTRASDLIRSRTMDAFFPLVATAVIYFVFCRVLAWGLGHLVKRLDMSQRPKTVRGVEMQDC